MSATSQTKKPSRAGRRVPPHELRTPRDKTMGVALATEEKAALDEMGRFLGFRSGGPFVSWILGNLFQLSRNQLHVMAWEADFYVRLEKAGALKPGDPRPNFSGEILPQLVAQLAASLDKHFGASEKREPAPVVGALDPEGGHGHDTA